jgi:hypothetical protein
MHRSTFFISALVEGEWSASRTAVFTYGESIHSTLWIGDWASPIAGLEDVEK